MKETEISITNGIIAEFDGWLKNTTIFNSPTYLKNGVIKHEHEFNYHNSWDALMPVVERIENLENAFTIQIDFTDCIINQNDNWSFGIHTTGINKIEAVYKAVIEFIKWYNTQSK